MPLAVGSDRLAAVWSSVAQKTGFNFVGDELSRDVGVCRLAVRREHGGRGRIRVVGEATFRDVGLGLAVRKGKLVCRDAEQSRLLEDATASLCAVEQADDRQIRCLMNGAGTRPDELRDFVQRFEALVRAFDDTRRTLPPPADAAHLVPAFRLASRQLGGELDPASMAVRGIRDEIEFALESSWQGGELARFVVSARPTMPIDGRYHQTLDGKADLPQELVPLADSALGVVVDAHTIRLVFPPREDDVPELANRVEALIALARRLSGRAGGYR